jgi:prephenate dehydrogenase
MRISTLVVVGVGLLGGSLGLAARRRGLAGRVLGVGRPGGSIERALAQGVIDEVCASLEEAAARANLMVFCTPVDRIAEQVLAAAPACAAGTLLTDVGSTKAAIVRAVQGHLPAGVAFVGSHPLAGSEKTGPEHARADLFEGRLVLVTPAGAEDEEARVGVCAFWEAVGAQVRIMDPEAHDRALALTSHLPHLVASALAGLLPPELYDLTAGGFRDSTRIAAAGPALWSAIFRSNRAALLAVLENLEERLGGFRQALADDDEAALQALLTQGKQVRDALR